MRVAPSPYHVHRSSMKGQLRKELRARRRGLDPADHALRSNLAASAITRLAAFKPGARVAVYLPFDRETNTAALLVAARRRGVRIYVPVIESRRHRATALLSVVRQDPPRRIRHLGPARRRAPPHDRPALVRSHRGAAGGRRRRGAAPGDGRRILRSGARLPAHRGIAGAVLAWWASPSSVSAPTRCMRRRTTSAWMRWRPSAASALPPRSFIFRSEAAP